MRFAYSIKQKTKVAVILFCIMGGTILIRIYEDRIVKNMNNAFISMYNDRLIPATDLFYIAENLYAKRFLLEAMLYDNPKLMPVPELYDRLKNHDISIDSLVGKYEQTSLIGRENKYLTELKTRLAHTRLITDKIIQLSTDHSINEGRILFETSGKDSFKRTSMKLSDLTRVQTDVGEELLRNSEFMVSGSKLFSSVQIGLAIIIGLLIVSIVSASNVLKVNNDKFRSN